MNPEIKNIIFLRDHEELFAKAAEWFSSVWSIPASAYLESFHESLNSENRIPRWYIAEGRNGEWIAGIGVIQNDFHKRTDLFPNVCAVYVKEEYRKKSIARFMLDLVCDELALSGIEDAYLVTDHIGFYEKCGWDFYCMTECSDGEKSRVYHRKTAKNAEKVRETPYYAGKINADSDFSDGALPHVVGASNFQVLRANRDHPEEADNIGNTYNHAPDMTFAFGRFWIQYLSNPVDEHAGMGISLVTNSKDGIHWSKPVVSFPPLLIPPGTNTCSDGSTITIPPDTYAVMHQRTAFYVSVSGRLLTTGFYGYSPDHAVPWEKNGIGRVVREIYEDGSMGEIYFLHLLTASGWTFDRLPYPSFEKNEDDGFVAVCRELLSDRLLTQQFAEEHGNDDELIHLKTHNEAFGKNENKPYQAFTWYHITENDVAALWKQSVVGISHDNGETWKIVREPSFVTSGAKMWGQKTSDGKFLLSYVNNLSSEHRYPLAAAVSEDGIKFDGLCSVFGETPPRRYDGLFKDFGPQYLRGISEGNAVRPSDAVWLCHSVNKEDIWVTRIPIPLKTTAEKHGEHPIVPPYADSWNLYSGIYSPVLVEEGELVLRDSDPVEYARAELIFPVSEKVRVSFDFSCDAETPVFAELCDEKGKVCARLHIDVSSVSARYTSVLNGLAKIGSGFHHIDMEQDCVSCDYRVFVDGRLCGILRNMQKVSSVSRLVFRTKPARKAPGMEVRPIKPDLPDSSERIKEKILKIKNVITEEL